MKKLFGLATVLLATVTLAACGSSAKDDTASSSADTTKLVVGATTSPHAEILNEAKPLLKKEGVDLEVKSFTDYTLLNKLLAEKEIDANYFQHKPYFEDQVKENGYDFVDAGAIHIEPMGIYSKDIKSVDDIKDGTTVITSNSNTDWGRILTIFENAGLIKLKDGVEKTTATFDDIVENKKDLKFKHDIDPGLLVPTYENEKDALVAINANFALTAGLNPEKDALLHDDDNSPYANIIAVRKGDENKPAIKKLIAALHSDEVKKFVDDKWKGSVKIVDAK
ncbi:MULTISPECIES: MetQ/NlpA family ABC transporter substrate-binding protein [Enterococcus]|uniref:Lipoprotein n=1 Tax=Enterococcus dispar ATCC 51266 TaxID=1139219 RepID=S1P1B3_9ENTE|nr:MetQ/NlpA family ABC transporter substrate-binding protein [Enterococcus dispar]EOT40773.1 D-methionine-binding lipoprotein MetQ [Enterococcus dispar ATCC 51266]EOW86854.1 D-methionine-binding lipoprotein MetQ [Enterococcus dispar ATCC 51266]MCU7357775.1 MetQ/NlpA family ABC transporter substrate-binding protein [Enterococcus dispar]MDT2706218.1 MetQ/NlpA family ABC transporter substrate-binding protein [Enterococcus dispar]WCG34118.1 MetQ/NlpA family ABC transporter substrate-binding prote